MTKAVYRRVDHPTSGVPTRYDPALIGEGPADAAEQLAAGKVYALLWLPDPDHPGEFLAQWGLLTYEATGSTTQTGWGWNWGGNWGN